MKTKQIVEKTSNANGILLLTVSKKHAMTSVTKQAVKTMVSV